jgi:hypothetical protein
MEYICIFIYQVWQLCAGLLRSKIYRIPFTLFFLLSLLSWDMGGIAGLQQPP